VVPGRSLTPATPSGSTTPGSRARPPTSACRCRLHRRSLHLLPVICGSRQPPPAVALLHAGVPVMLCGTLALACSQEQAGERRADVFMGIDCFGRGTFGGGGFACDVALEACLQHGLSGALAGIGSCASGSVVVWCGVAWLTDADCMQTAAAAVQLLCLPPAGRTRATAGRGHPPAGANATRSSGAASSAPGSLRTLWPLAQAAGAACERPHARLAAGSCRCSPTFPWAAVGPCTCAGSRCRRGLGTT
jgi:hypothetical protein